MHHLLLEQSVGSLDSSRPGGAMALGFVCPPPLVAGMGGALCQHGEGS